MMQGEKKQNGIWKRYPYLFNKYKNISLQCFCGKCYYSFPALYLHCQRKHNKKITTHLVKQEYQSARNLKAKTVTYLLDEEGNMKRIEVPNKNQELNILKKILKQFSADCLSNRKKNPENSSEPSERLRKMKALRIFQKYLVESVQQTEDDIGSFVDKIPYLFNNYVTSEEINIGEEYSITCQVLHELGTWMKEKKHTTLTTLKNDPENNQDFKY